MKSETSEQTLMPGEDLILNIAFQLTEKIPPFYLAVSNQAVFWHDVSFFTLNRAAVGFKRIENRKITEVRIRRLPPYGLWVFAAFLVVVGVVMLYLMYLPDQYVRSGWPLAFVVGGIIVPFTAKGRTALEVASEEKTYRWQPPLVVDEASRKKIQELFQSIIQASEKAGLRVRQE
jgi:hypothetical protein